MVTNQHLLSDRMNRRRLAKPAGGSLLIAGAAIRPGRALATIKNESTPNASPMEGASLTIYSGRSESLVGALIPKIGAATGLKLDVRYGNTAELAAQILEEGKNTPAGLFFAQDAGALGALSKAELFTTYPLADNVPAIADLTPLAELQTPAIDLSNLDDLEGTLALLTELSLI